MVPKNESPISLSDPQINIPSQASHFAADIELYRIWKFATEKTVLEVILPKIEAGQHFDDRLADTLDALFDYGIGNLDLLITGNMIDVFHIASNACCNDATSVSMEITMTTKL